MKKAEQYKKERDILAERIATLAIKAGIIEDQDLTGPQLEQVCDDLEKIIQNSTELTLGEKEEIRLKRERKRGKAKELAHQLTEQFIKNKQFIGQQ